MEEYEASLRTGDLVNFQHDTAQLDLSILAPDLVHHDQETGRLEAAGHVLLQFGPEWGEVGTVEDNQFELTAFLLKNGDRHAKLGVKTVKNVDGKTACWVDWEIDSDTYPDFTVTTDDEFTVKARVKAPKYAQLGNILSVETEPIQRAVPLEASFDYQVGARQPDGTYRVELSADTPFSTSDYFTKNWDFQWRTPDGPFSSPTITLNMEPEAVNQIKLTVQNSRGEQAQDVTIVSLPAPSLSFDFSLTKSKFNDPDSGNAVGFIAADEIELNYYGDMKDVKSAPQTLEWEWYEDGELFVSSDDSRETMANYKRNYDVIPAHPHSLSYMSRLDLTETDLSRGSSAVYKLVVKDVFKGEVREKAVDEIRFTAPQLKGYKPVLRVADHTVDDEDIDLEEAVQLAAPRSGWTEPIEEFPSDYKFRWVWFEKVEGEDVPRAGVGDPEDLSTWKTKVDMEDQNFASFIRQDENSGKDWLEPMDALSVGEHEFHLVVWDNYGHRVRD